VNTTDDHIVQRLRAEFMEMPGLRLTVPQLQRLCGVEPMVCQRALDALVNAKCLCRKPDGSYARLTDGEDAHRRPAKADIPIDRTTAKAS
jgi:hypothetical protein